MNTHCDIYGKEGARVRKVAKTYGKGEDIFVIENVPAEVCVKCGEKTYSPEVTDERFEHIIPDHPEMSDQIDNIKYTLENPDTVVR